MPSLKTIIGVSIWKAASNQAKKTLQRPASSTALIVTALADTPSPTILNIPSSLPKQRHSTLPILIYVSYPNNKGSFHSKSLISNLTSNVLSIGVSLLRSRLVDVSPQQSSSAYKGLSTALKPITFPMPMACRSLLIWITLKVSVAKGCCASGRRLIR